jgi:putative flavoprotein involved in K+ transport
MPDPQVVIVGAGQAGLAASWHLARLGVHHVVLEQGSVGDTWRTARWESFRLNTPAWANLLPGETDPLGSPGDFHTRDAWAAHLTGYAHVNGLPVEEGSPVTRVTRTADGASLELDVGGSSPRTLRARAVLVASGMQRAPRTPPVAASLPDSVRSLHSAGYREAGALPPGGVLVVGGAQSGCQIAEDLLEAGRPVWLAASPAPRMPRRYRGRDIFEWLVTDGFFDQTLGDLPDPAMRWWPQPNISGVGPGGRTLSLQSVRDQGGVLTGRVAGIEHGVVRFAPDLVASIRMGDELSARTRRRVDALIAERGIAAPPPESDAADAPVRDPEAIAAPDSLDLAAAGVGSVIWATGFGADLSWIDIPLPTDRGQPVHVDGAVAPGVWFLGIPWMRQRRSGIILGADADGASVAGRAAAWFSG